MSDQAQGLRVLAQQQKKLARSEKPEQRSCCRTIAITSGKGGVGKTNLTANLAILMARDGERVLVFDADLGLANIDVLLGVSPPYNLHHVLQGAKTLEDIVISGPGGIAIITGGSGILDLAHLSEERREAVLSDFPRLDRMADVVLFDTGAGLSQNVLAFVLAADEVLVVTTPEPTAMADAYAMIKVVSQKNPEAILKLVVNMAADGKEAGAIAQNIMSVSRRFLQVPVAYLGHVPADASMGKAIRRQQALSLAYPASPAAQHIARIAAGLGCRTQEAQNSRFAERIRRFFG
ncbi:MAG: MinD/ParA family protein [Armatimonadetes bacterium]|nr:MinD/ParA family protein [Armatimonadota bacterium]